jgi:hypothetical protein
MNLLHTSLCLRVHPGTPPEVGVLPQPAPSLWEETLPVNDIGTSGCFTSSELCGQWLNRSGLGNGQCCWQKPRDN